MTPSGYLTSIPSHITFLRDECTLVLPNVSSLLPIFQVKQFLLQHAYKLQIRLTAAGLIYICSLDKYEAKAKLNQIIQSLAHEKR